MLNLCVSFGVGSIWNPIADFFGFETWIPVLFLIVIMRGNIWNLMSGFKTFKLSVSYRRGKYNVTFNFLIVVLGYRFESVKLVSQALCLVLMFLKLSSCHQIGIIGSIHHAWRASIVVDPTILRIKIHILLNVLEGLLMSRQ